VEQAIPCAQQHALYAADVPPTRDPEKKVAEVHLSMLVMSKYLLLFQTVNLKLTSVLKPGTQLKDFQIQH
jgi:hypothetical protein